MLTIRVISSVTARHHMGGTVLSGEVRQRPHDAHLPFNAVNAHWIDDIILVQYLGILPGEDFNAGTAADTVVGAVGQQHGVQYREDVRVGDEVCRARRVSKRAGKAVRGITIEVVFKLPADRIKVRLQFICDFGHQSGRRKIGHEDNAVFAKRFGLCR